MDNKYKKEFESLEGKYSSGMIEFAELKNEIENLQPLYTRIQKTIFELSKNIKNKNTILKLARIRDNLFLAIKTVN